MGSFNSPKDGGDMGETPTAWQGTWKGILGEQDLHL